MPPSQASCRRTGGNDAFARPGHFAPCADPEWLREEVLLGISQHDNGWWEWEASPRLSAEEGLPVDLTEVLEDPIETTDRWRLGVRRFQDRHPYASLLIGLSGRAKWCLRRGGAKSTKLSLDIA